MHAGRPHAHAHATHGRTPATNTQHRPTTSTDGPLLGSRDHGASFVLVAVGSGLSGLLAVAHLWCTSTALIVEDTAGSSGVRVVQSGIYGQQDAVVYEVPRPQSTI